VSRLALWPAIDLKGGKVVRLLKGEWDQTTTFESDPVEAAKGFEREGADGIHVVDLDAAFGKAHNREITREILRKVSIPVEVGGGLHSREVISSLFEEGAARAVLGTLPFRDPGLFLTFLREFGSRLVVALDCREGRPTVKGWTEDAGQGNASAAAASFASLGVSVLLVTDVSRDGAMTGPNLDLLLLVRSVFPGEILASGGMRGEEDLEGVERALAGGERGAIFGRALHGGATSVARLKAARDRMALIGSPAGRAP
jgi:phosphoribosylformimino-5-aminoimidazole carboxamide ribotide isomerase